MDKRCRFPTTGQDLLRSPFSNSAGAITFSKFTRRTIWLRIVPLQCTVANSSGPVQKHWSAIYCIYAIQWFAVHKKVPIWFCWNVRSSPLYCVLQSCVAMLNWVVLGGATRVRLRQLMGHFDPYLHHSPLPWQSHKIVKPFPHLALLHRDGSQTDSCVSNFDPLSFWMIIQYHLVLSRVLP